MNEYTIGWIASGTGLGLIISSTLYWLGGRKHKAIRRWGSAFTMAATVCGSAYFMGVFKPGMLALFVSLTIAYHLGYGADTLIEKVRRRAIYAIGVLVSGCVMVMCLNGTLRLDGLTGLLWAHIGVGAWSIYMGVRNPVRAVAEEYFVCMLLNLLLCGYVFVGVV